MAQKFEAFMENKETQLYNLRHSAAHLLAQAVCELFPDTKLTIGPVTEDGFFYDFLPLQNFKEEDLAKIEAGMHELSKKNYKIVGGQVPKDEAKKIYKDNRFKLEIIDGISDPTVGIYHQGDFFDLCRGGHVEAIGEIKYFKLTGISGSYWRGDRSGQPLQRISGIAFLTQEDLENHLKRLEDAKLYDHRRLGKQLDLFTFHDDAAGFPFFHAKGLLIYNKLIEYSREMQKDDYQEIRTPILNSENLYRTSGHYDNYKENMYSTEIEGESYWLKPMNCPSHILIYKEKPRSYRELPIRYSEYGHVHRRELSGVLHGLFRVRGFTQDDAHIFCTAEQIEGEVKKVLGLVNEMYRKFGFNKIKMALSTKPAKSMGSDELWNKATTALANALKETNSNYIVQEGDGAFYGPKIDIKIEDSVGREWQCSTIQVDFNQPINFKLEYIDSDQKRNTPVIIHRAIFGSLERFLGVLLEHYKGLLPFWLAPIQTRILLITDSQREYSQKIKSILQSSGIRVEIDDSCDQISGQIRQAQMEKIPLMIVLGKKEQENETVTFRYNDGKQEFGIKLSDLLDKISVLS